LNLISQKRIIISVFFTLLNSADVLVSHNTIFCQIQIVNCYLLRSIKYNIHRQGPDKGGQCPGPALSGGGTFGEKNEWQMAFHE